MAEPERTQDDIDFFETVDGWGAAEWFDRLAKAIRRHDEARAAGNDLVADTMHMIASSSAFRLVRDYEQEVRTALIKEPSNA